MASVLRFLVGVALVSGGMAAMHEGNLGMEVVGFAAATFGITVIMICALE